MHHFYKEYFTVGLSLARLRIDAAFFYKNPKSSREAYAYALSQIEQRNARLLPSPAGTVWLELFIGAGLERPLP